MKKNLIYVLMAAGLVQLSSCAKENFVNPVPTNVISDLTAFDSKDRFAQFMLLLKMPVCTVVVT